MTGAVPVVIGDWVLPWEGDQDLLGFNWERCVVRVDGSDLESLVPQLRAIADDSEAFQMRHTACRTIFRSFLATPRLIETTFFRVLRARVRNI